MKKTYRDGFVAVTCAAALLVAAPAAHALSSSYTTTIDVLSMVNPGTSLESLADGKSGQGIFQSFGLVGSSIAGAGIYLAEAGDSETYTMRIDLFDKNVLDPSVKATPLTFGTMSFKNSAKSWVEVLFNDSKVLKQDTYVLQFSIAAGISPSNVLLGGAYQGPAGPYTGGAPFIGNPPGQPKCAGTNSAPECPDFIFRTYALAAPIPEPETWVLMLSGLGLLAWRARRRA